MSRNAGLNHLDYIMSLFLPYMSQRKILEYVSVLRHFRLYNPN